jgi:hypothetical protein
MHLGLYWLRDNARLYFIYFKSSLADEKPPLFCRTQNIVAAFNEVLYLTLSLASRIHFTPIHYLSVL